METVINIYRTYPRLVFEGKEMFWYRQPIIEKL